MPNLRIKIVYVDPTTQHPFSFEQDGECNGFIELPEAVYKTVYKSLSKSFGEYKFKELVEKPKPQPQPKLVEKPKSPSPYDLSRAKKSPKKSGK